MDVRTEKKCMITIVHFYWDLPYSFVALPIT